MDLKEMLEKLFEEALKEASKATSKEQEEEGGVREQVKALFRGKIRSLKTTDGKIKLEKEKEKEKYPEFEEIYHIGDAKLEDDKEVAFFTIKVKTNLSERESKKRQYELAKYILSLDGFMGKDAGIFVFYDTNGNFRISL
ncbi:MAG: hypothetical protein ACP5K4_11205, partial [Caldisericum sp.]